MNNEQINVLIVDDDKSIGEMLYTLLEFYDIQADVINDPGQIDNKIQVGNFDLIILDMRLSGISGIDICSRLKSEATTKNIPVLMMSASSDAAESCKEAGADGFISKPFEMDELLARIREMVAV